MKRRQKYAIACMLIAALGAGTELTAAQGGLTDPVVCLTPVMFGAMLLTPTATLGEAAADVVDRLRAQSGGK